MGFFLGFLCGLLFLPLSILAAMYYFFTFSESYEEKRREILKEQQRKELEYELDLEDMPSALYASYLALRHQNAGNGIVLPGMGSVPEHLDPQYQFAGWISVKRIPEVDHRIIEPSAKETKKVANKNGQTKSSYSVGMLEDGGYGRGVAGSLGAGAAQDSRFTYLDTQNPHLSLPPCLQARFKDSKYCVVKGTTIFIYENEQMLECLGVITVPHYKVSVPGLQKDSNIYSRRNPIWLQCQPTAGSEASQTSSKDYYLSMVNCVDKEDLYFTLLRCSKLKTNPRPFLREIPKRDSTMFDKSAMNTLIRTIHSNEHQFQSAWLNALMGRIFLGVYKTPQVKDMMFQKLVDKLSRIRLPNILNDIRMKSLHLGDGFPFITRPKLLSMKPNGDLLMDMNLLYQGGFRAEIEAEAVVIVTKKIQPIKVSMVLAVTLVRLEGRVQAWVKPPPCNRIWYGFYHKPQVEMKIEPVVSDKHIKSNLIIKAIENKLLEAIAETMVLPNMDDFPFSETDGVGGIFGEEILPGGETPAAAAADQDMAKTLPLRSFSPATRSATRSATINLTETSVNTPRSAIELPSDQRHRAETISTPQLPPQLYQNIAGSRSFGSLSDELMHNYDSHNKLMTVTEDDPMRNGAQRLRTSVESTDSQIGRSRANSKPSSEHGSKAQSLEGAIGTNSSGLLQRRNPGSSMEPIRGGGGSLDRSTPLSYTTGSSAASSSHTSSTFPAMDNAPPMEDHWSQYGISEYDPLAPPHLKDKKKMKEKAKGSEKDKHSNDVDHMSVCSKDSGDSGSTHTGNTHLTENTAHSSTLFGFSNSSNSTIDLPSSRSDKFSLARMLQGLRKKHTKNSHSGSALSSLQSHTNSVNGFGRDESNMHEEDEQDANSVLTGDDEGFILDSETPPYHNLLGVSTSASAQYLSSAYQPHHRKKFESTPNLSSGLYTSEQGNSTSGVGSDSAHSVHEDYEFLAARNVGSPTPSVYAASLFGGDEPKEQLANGHGAPNSRLPPPTTHNPSLMNLSPKFGATFFNLRGRSRSGSSKEDLSIPPDLNLVLGPQQHQHKMGLPGSECSSKFSIQTDSYDMYSCNTNVHADPCHTNNIRGAGAPIIVLQKPSPYLSHGESLSPQYPERQPGRVSMDDSRLQHCQINPNMRLNQGPPSPVANGKLDSPTIRARRHSINHPPSISSIIHTTRHHTHVHGLGVTPASPLRKGFTQEEDEDEVDFGSSISVSETSGRTRNNSDTFLLTSTASSSQSTTSHIHHSSALRQMLSSFASKHKKKPHNDDPNSTVGIVGTVGVMSMSQVKVPSVLEGDPFSHSGVADEHSRTPRVSQENKTSDSLDAPLRAEENSAHVLEECKMHTLDSLLENPSLSPAQSIMGKALSCDSCEEILHARPGYIGEYPTPVRLHSMLNRESAAVRALIGKDDEVTLNCYQDSLDPASYQSPKIVGERSDTTSDLGALMENCHSVPVDKARTLPELPVELLGEEVIPLEMPRVTLSSEPSTDHLSSDNQDGSRETEKPSTSKRNDSLSSSSIGTNSSQTTARCEYDKMVMTTNPPQPLIIHGPCLPPLPSPPAEEEEGPSLSDDHDQARNQETVMDKEGLLNNYDSVAVIEENGFLQPSAMPFSSEPGTKKSHPRNIFKRLIRRKSEGTLNANPSDARQQHQQQQQQQLVVTEPLPLLSYDQLEKQVHLSPTQISEHPDATVGIIQSQASEKTFSASPSSSPSSSPKALTRVKARPRSSTIHVFSTSRY